MDVGYKLKIIRLQNNLKQQHIADVLGITRSAYCSYEIGCRAVDLDTLVKISKFYNLPVDVFFENELDNAFVQDDSYENDIETRFLSQLSRKEIDLIVKYRMMNKDDKKEIDDLVDSKVDK